MGSIYLLTIYSLTSQRDKASRFLCFNFPACFPYYLHGERATEEQKDPWCHSKKKAQWFQVLVFRRYHPDLWFGVCLSSKELKALHRFTQVISILAKCHTGKYSAIFFPTHQRTQKAKCQLDLKLILLQAYFMSLKHGYRSFSIYIQIIVGDKESLLFKSSATGGEKCCWKKLGHTMCVKIWCRDRAVGGEKTK